MNKPISFLSGKRNNQKAKGTDQHEIEQKLMRWSNLGEDELFREFESDLQGLTPVEADERINRYGKNIIESRQKRSVLKNIAAVLINPFNLVLLVVLAITFLTDVVLVSRKDFSATILIFSTILISTIVGYTQEAKSTNAAAKLRKMIENKVDVIRNGLAISILLEDVVPGDIVKLSSGDMLPGDVRFISVKDLYVDQATLTGESAPVEKLISNSEKSYITDVQNIGFMGTNITSGLGTALVLTTGADTYFGSMAKSLSTDNEQSDFEKEVGQISKLLIRFMFVMVPVILIVNLFTKNNVVDAVLFSITISIGLIPEMLPVIMTSTLAKGAVDMSKKETIVKRLSSIQTFGEMDVLCTDKTGTLTQDEIVLEKYLNVDGKEDMSVLKQAFVNSYFQTGLKNAIDNAIINRVEKENFQYKSEYKVVDEIPFDFARRRMSVVVEKLGDSSAGRILVTKGAAEEVLSCCSFSVHEGQSVPMTEDERKKALHIFD